MNATGHFRTVSAVIRRTLFPTKPPASTTWSTSIDDPLVGRVALSGRLSCPANALDLAILVHGLGGSSDSGYMTSAARAADALGMACLRFNLRGADGRSGDFYHGGLTTDLHAAVSALSASGFERFFVLGFSLGGHVTLRFATEVDEPRVVAVAAVCSPLDLAAGVQAIDRPLMAPYRAYVLRRLKANYESTARLGSVPTPPGELQSVRTLREWDSLTVVPRFGFDDPDDYYAKASVGPVMDRLRRPALLLAAEDDPMIPPVAIRPALAAARETDAVKRFLTVRWIGCGGHLGFQSRLDLGLEGPPGMESQILLWLLQTAAGRRRSRSVFYSLSKTS